MLLLDPHREAGAPGRRHQLALFGVGLVGSAIAAALVKRSYREAPMPLSWDEPERQDSQLEKIARRIEAAMESAADETATPAVVSFVWSAGKAGFASSEGETAPELAAFRKILELAESIARRHRRAAVDFHLISSVGGLFEGQRHVDGDSEPTVLRPYGALKLRQERLLGTSEHLRARRIYRLSSVFGPAPGGQRRGLIPTLIRNGQRQEVTRIVGRPTTLRDFVWTADVGRYLARELDRLETLDSRVSTLASAKPTSIHEIVELVESILRRRLYVQFDASLSNSMDITVSSSLLPANWHASDLGTVARQIYLATLHAA